MKTWFGLFIVVIISTTVTTEAEGRSFRRRAQTSSSSSTGSYAMREAISPALQAIAQHRANAMAAGRSLDHNIHQYTSAPSWNVGGGVSEGIGMSTTSNPKSCSTCVTGSVVVADAYAYSGNSCYRVRLFK